jgi:hypothetical protein
LAVHPLTTEHRLSTPRRTERGQADLNILADWLDAKFRVPGLGIRFGIDALLGLLPGVGDAASALASLYILSAASRAGVSRATVARMGLNIGLDAVVGAIPLLGDLFDVYWKANQRNVALLQRHLQAAPEQTRRLNRRDRGFVALLIVTLGLLAVGAFAVTVMIAGWLWTQLTALF